MAPKRTQITSFYSSHKEILSAYFLVSLCWNHRLPQPMLEKNPYPFCHPVEKEMVKKNPAPEYPIRTVSNFFENSRRYSQLKVDHRCHWHWWQMKKIFNQKNFTNFVGHLWIVELTYIYSFAFKFTLKYLQPDINSIVCHWCRWQRGQICRRCRWYRWQFANGIVDTGGKFATGINSTSETGGKICHRCRWYRWSTLSCEYLREFSKKFETVLMVYSGAWGKLIHEKNQKQKISRHSPFKLLLVPLGQRPCNTRRPAWLRRRRRSSDCSWLSKVQKVLSQILTSPAVRKLNFQLQFYSQQGQNDRKIPRKKRGNFMSSGAGCSLRGAGAGGFSK